MDEIASSMDLAMQYAMQMAVVTGKPVMVRIDVKLEPITHVCGNEPHDGLKINCDVYNRFLDDVRAFCNPNPEGVTNDSAGKTD